MRIIILLLPLTLSSCSYMTYTGYPDGSTHIEGYAIGTKTVLEGASLSISKEGERKFDLQGYDSDKVTGIEQINQGLSLIIEGVAKGAK